MTRAEAVDSPADLPNTHAYNRPWLFPDCPQCEGHLFVDKSIGTEDWMCHKCDRHWTIKRRE